MIVDLSKLPKPPAEPPRPRLRFVRLGHLESVTERLYLTRELIAQLEREAPTMRPYANGPWPCRRDPEEEIAQMNLPPEMVEEMRRNPKFRAAVEDTGKASLEKLQRRNAHRENTKNPNRRGRRKR